MDSLQLFKTAYCLQDLAKLAHGAPASRGSISQAVIWNFLENFRKSRFSSLQCQKKV